MSAESNIILITNDKNIEQILKPKLVLLREIDNILVTPYSDAIANIKKVKPEMVLIYCGEEKRDCLGLIKLINSDEELKKVIILLVAKEYDQDFVLSAYDENITDYFTLRADDVEILMRTIWSLKKNMLIKTIKKQQNLFEALGVIDKETGFYTQEYCDKIFENEAYGLESINSDSILMLISASEESKTMLNPAQLAKAIKSSTRTSDIVIHAPSNRFYVLLPGTNLKGAFCVWDKIKRQIGENYGINAGVSTIGQRNFDELKSVLLNALLESISTNRDIVIVNEDEKEFSGDWLEKVNSTQKNFKLFKQAFNKKLEKVITPIFFQMQKLYEEKLFQTKIEQYSNSALSSFILRKDDNRSELKITYPGFSKINIDMIHHGLDTPENKRISLDLTELDESKLTEILEEFINEFKTSTEN